MLRFGRASRQRLATVVDELQRLAQESLATGIMDFSVTDALRPKDRQNQYFAEGKSKVQWPDSKHNVLNPGDKAKAFDLTPWVDGKSSYDKYHCCVLAGVVLTKAKELGIEIRWGGNWDRDLEPVTDQDFNDLVHYEIVD